MATNPVLGLALHSVGAFSASSCYTPQKQTKAWSWEVYWIAQASFAWLILPIAVAFLTVPDFPFFEGRFEDGAVTELVRLLERERLQDAMQRSFLLGVLYGVGGLTFGLGIRYIGFSLNYAIAIGISAGLGTLVPLIWHPNEGFTWEIREKFSTGPGLLVLAGVLISLAGIALCGWAGALRERHGGKAPGRYSLRVGVPLAVLAGVLSSVFNFSLIAGDPIRVAAQESGMSELLAMNAIYPFSHGGALVPSVVWCLFLLWRHRTASQFVRLPAGESRSLGFYYLMAALSGGMWYTQFLFYGMGHSHMGKEFGFTSWALHMAMLILFSNVYGKLFREWEGATRRARALLYVGMGVIVAATLVITWGNWLAES